METTRPTLANEPQPPVNFDEIVADFELLEDWEDRYRYVIELGRRLEPLPEEEHSPANKVQGCVSQVWLSTRVDRSGGVPRLIFIGDSDAHIVRGLIAILFALYSGKTAEEIDSLDRSAPAPWFRHSEPPATCQGWADAYGRRCRKKIPAGRDYCANHEKQAVPA